MDNMLARSTSRSDEIAAAWTRSRLSGVAETAQPKPCAFDVEPSRLVRAAQPVLDKAAQDLAATSLGLVLADRDARVLQTRFEDARLHEQLRTLGVAPGTRLNEELVGANGIGTPLEIRRGLLMYGADHYMTAFREFTCYGQPIVNPITKRLEGVLNIGGSSAQHGLFGVVAKQLVADIEQRLEETAADSHRRLLAAFHAASGRASRRPVVLVSDDLVLATPAALDLLDTADHAVIRAVVDDMRSTRGSLRRGVSRVVDLTSGRPVELRCTPVDAADGVVVELLPAADSTPVSPGPAPSRFPLLIVGETGSGRTTLARRAASENAPILDAADLAWNGEQPWSAQTLRLLSTPGPDVIVENVHLLSASAAASIANAMTTTPRRVIVTTTPGVHLTDDLAPIVARCAAREDLVPLRNRSHDVPHLAQQMLAEVATSKSSRLTAQTLRVLAAQQWPGNLTELRRIVAGLVQVRSVGDIVPADLPTSHRQSAAVSSPVQQAERDVIKAAIDAAGGNKVRAARALGVSRSTLYNKMRALELV